MDAERTLVEAAQQDPARFAALYDAHFAQIYAFVMRRVRDRAAAEDVTAEVFRLALAGIRTFEWRGVPFVAWLYRIAANEVADHMKKASRETGDVCVEEAAPDEIALVEQRAQLYRLVDRLPADQRKVIVMRFAEERSVREVATEIGRHGESGEQGGVMAEMTTIDAEHEPVLD